MTATGKHGREDAAAFEKLNVMQRYVDGDYKDAATFQAICSQLNGTQHPARY